MSHPSSRYQSFATGEKEDGMKERIIISTPEERETERCADKDFVDVIIQSAKKSEDGYEIGMDGSLMGWFPWPLKMKPAVGSKLRVYTKMLFGQERYGYAYWHDGMLIPIEYKTKIERDAERTKWLKDYEDERIRENAASRERHADLSFLPLPLRLRVERFRAEDDAGGKDYHEPYELAAITEASRLFARSADPGFGAEIRRRGIFAPTEDAYQHKRSYEREKEDGRLDWPDTPEWRLIAFDSINSKMNDYQYEIMDEIMPEMDKGHSGNTWGAAMMMALALVRHGDDAKL